MFKRDAAGVALCRHVPQDVNRRHDGFDQGAVCGLRAAASAVSGQLCGIGWQINRRLEAGPIVLKVHRRRALQALCRGLMDICPLKRPLRLVEWRLAPQYAQRVVLFLFVIQHDQGRRVSVFYHRCRHGGECPPLGEVYLRALAGAVRGECGIQRPLAFAAAAADAGYVPDEPLVVEIKHVQVWCLAKRLDPNRRAEERLRKPSHLVF